MNSNRHGADICSLGPIQNPGMMIQSGPDGIHAEHYAPVEPLKMTSPWRAKWIGLPEPESDVICMRKVIVLGEIPSRVVAWMSADLQYRLYINSQLVSRGPVDAWDGPWDAADDSGCRGYWFYDARDLTAFFRKGENVIAVECFNTKLKASWHSVIASRAFIFQAELTLPDGGTATLASDESWRGLEGEYLQEKEWLVFDAAREPLGWKTARFDDAGWSPCVEIGDSKRPELTFANLPPLMEAVVQPSAVVLLNGDVALGETPFRNGHGVTLTKDGAFLLKFSRILSGRVGLKVKGGAGAVIQLRFAEREESNPLSGRRVCELYLRDGVQEFEAPFYTSFVTVEVEVSHVTTPVEILELRPVFVSYPVNYRGAFACSDEQLNRLWQTSRWTVQICMQDYHLDCPNGQEPLMDPGDYFIEALVNYYSFGDPLLPRQDLRKFGRIMENRGFRNFHTSYSLLWLQMLMDYYDYTADRTLVQEIAPQVHGLLDLFAGYIGANGILSEARDYMFMDFVEIEGFNCHHPPAVIGQGYLTAFYYRALADGIRVAELTGDPARAEVYRKLREEIAEAFHRELWVPEKGLYRDGKPGQSRLPESRWLPADKPIETFSPHVNTLAVLYDLAPKEWQAAILDTILSVPKLDVQPYFMHFVFDAMAHAGRFEKYGMEQIRRWKIVPETQSFLELWERGDLSHGWCSTPLIQLSSRVLGVKPAASGYEQVAIEPMLCGLTWARGKVPTPRGDVEVSWQRHEASFELEISIPEHTTARVRVPSQDGALFHEVAAGRHQFHSSL